MSNQREKDLDWAREHVGGGGVAIHAVADKLEAERQKASAAAELKLRRLSRVLAAMVNRAGGVLRVAVREIEILHPQTTLDLFTDEPKRELVVRITE